MGQTKAQRHNAMMERVYAKYHEIENSKKDFLPTISEYSFFLDKAEEKLKITRDQARDLYGRYTYGQWKELLKLF